MSPDSCSWEVSHASIQHVQVVCISHSFVTSQCFGQVLVFKWEGSEAANSDISKIICKTLLLSENVKGYELIQGKKTHIQLLRPKVGMK